MFHERERFLFENILAEQICCGIHNNKCINNLLLDNKITYINMNKDDSIQINIPLATFNRK